MRKECVLVTGANGEVGRGLIQQLARMDEAPGIVALDLLEMDASIVGIVNEAVTGDILDQQLMRGIIEKYEINTVYHLAAVLSTQAERKPFIAHRVNVEGTVLLMELLIERAQQGGSVARFIFPSSIAVYGLDNVDAKRKAGPLSEDQHNQSHTMYGCNKLYGERLGAYFSRNYQPASTSRVIDFRCLRFPGLISADTLPTGGTSDYAPEMLHAAARGTPYTAFVRPDTTIPFMAMPDAVKAMLMLAEARRDRLTTCVYNVMSFSTSAQRIAEIVAENFTGVDIKFEPDTVRQSILDSWPAEVDDSAARRDWGWSPDYDLNRAFNDYLIPTVRRRYRIEEPN
jgi:threonine 3-dehydrogenase